MIAPTHKPVVGIIGSSIDSPSVRAAIKQFEDAGTTVLLLANHDKRDARADLQRIDALVVMGNNADIDPAKYGAPVDSHTVNESNIPAAKARAAYEEALLAAALETKMPVLGICSGMQRINVLCGGNLHQHVPDLIGHNEHAQQNSEIAPYIPVQPILIEHDTTLSSIADTIATVFAPAPHHGNVLLENSMHHQAVAKLGNGLRASAYAEDALPSGERMIEAFEADPNGKFGKQFLLGVQWHPEFGASPLGEKIAERVTTEAHAFAQAHNRSHDLNDIKQQNALSAEDHTTISSGAASNLPPRHGSMTEMILKERARRDRSFSQSI